MRLISRKGRRPRRSEKNKRVSCTKNQPGGGDPSPTALEYAFVGEAFRLSISAGGKSLLVYVSLLFRGNSTQYRRRR